MARLDTARGDAAAPPRSAAPHEWRPGEPVGSTRALSRLDAISHPRLDEPWTIDTQVSSGCIRMRNEDVIDLYDRVKVGTKVVVL
jgi:hypothetical protein